jgi:mRNA interferase RelE/StbE
MTIWRVSSSDDFDKAVRKLDAGTRRRLFLFIQRLQNLDEPRALGRRLVNHPVGAWRFRVGDYRLLATIHDDQMVILALAFDHRSQVYRS